MSYEYATVVEALEYAETYGYVNLSEQEISGVLARASRAIDLRYGNRFIGRKSETNQIPQWPRVNFYSYEGDGLAELDQEGNYRYITGIPNEVKEATALMACLIATGLDPFTQPERQLKQETTEVGPVKTQITYQDGSSSVKDPFFIITEILRPLLKQASTLRVVR